MEKDMSLPPLQPVEAARSSDASLEDLVYLKDMLIELHAIARRQRLEMLAYLIDMAHFEALDQVKHIRGVDRYQLPPHNSAALD